MAKSQQEINWLEVLRTCLISREIDRLEETELLPQKKVIYQFSARGHDVPQIILGSLINHPRDSISAYYRSRPILLTQGLTIEDAFAGPLMKSGGFSDGRDIGVVCNLPSQGKATVLPMSGDVGSQYTPTVGWAQGLVYRAQELGDQTCQGAIAVVLGGEGSVATNGFWSALTIATTLSLPVLFYIEDNQYAISVTSEKQTPGANIAKNLASFSNLNIYDGNGSDPVETAKLFTDALTHVRSWKGPALVRLTVPRLSGHSGQDTQAYKTRDLIDSELARDPLAALIKYLSNAILPQTNIAAIEEQVKSEVSQALDAALKRREPDAEKIFDFVFDFTPPNAKNLALQKVGGLLPEGHTFPQSSSVPNSEPTRINMLTAIRRTLEHELKINPKVLVFGEDVGPKGGVHAATLGLQEQFGTNRVFDTSLSEEGIIGRSVGLALNGLLPVPEIQFRKYADPATEQLHNIGTMRWRTANRFAAPMVVRIPGGFAKCGDPWHSVSDEVAWIHSVGWQVLVPSNAEDAVGLLRAALRSNNPSIFFEHRHLLDNAWARRPYPGDDFVLPLGKARTIREGNELAIVTWGAMVERIDEACEKSGFECTLLDLRTLVPWDREAVLGAVKKCRRLLIVHEDYATCGFGAEISATVAKEAFFSLDAPIERLAVDDIPIPHNMNLMDHVIPSVDLMIETMKKIIET
ncbi:pyruvate dehydrogenase [bacterium]|nr:pyruvate dehydrogenase [bacterium]